VLVPRPKANLTQTPDSDLGDFLRRAVTGKKTLLICVGNRLRGDDGLGPYVAESLKGGVWNMRVIDCGTTVENHLQDILNLRPEVLLMVNAVDEGREAGTIIQREFENQASGRTASAHTVPLETVVLLIRSLMAQEGIRAYLLGVQAGSFIQFSDTVREAARTIARSLREVDHFASCLEKAGTHGA
jgi:hydrogenase 3 maturation protease